MIVESPEVRIEGSYNDMGYHAHRYDEHGNLIESHYNLDMYADGRNRSEIKESCWQTILDWSQEVAKEYGGDVNVDIDFSFEEGLPTCEFCYKQNPDVNVTHCIHCGEAVEGWEY